MPYKTVEARTAWYSKNCDKINQKRREQYVKRKNNPDYIAWRKRQYGKYFESHKNDGKYRAHRRTYWKEWHDKKKRDEVWASRKRQYRRSYQKIYRAQHQKQVLTYQREYYRKWREKNREKCRLYSRLRHQELKKYVLSHYSQDILKCARCGFNDVRALSLDHINGGGAKHRREIGGPSVWYSWLVKNNFPSGFQVLCMNCQFIKRVEDGKQWGPQQ